VHHCKDGQQGLLAARLEVHRRRLQRCGAGGLLHPRLFYADTQMGQRLEQDMQEKAGHIIHGTRTERSTTYYDLECKKCGLRSWRTGGFLKAKAQCPACSGGRWYHKARGYGDDPLFKRYWIIKRRLKSHPEYSHVTMCKEWEQDFLAFRAWALNHGYRSDLTIDRIDNSKGYSPDNCRWVTLKQQANNRRSNVRIDYDGKSMTLSELADYSMLPKNTVKLRYEHGWSLDDIVKTPYKARRKWSETNGYAE